MNFFKLSLTASVFAGFFVTASLHAADTVSTEAIASATAEEQIQITASTTELTQAQKDILFLKALMIIQLSATEEDNTTAENFAAHRESLRNFANALSEHVAGDMEAMLTLFFESEDLDDATLAAKLPAAGMDALSFEKIRTIMLICKKLASIPLDVPQGMTLGRLTPSDLDFIFQGKVKNPALAHEFGILFNSCLVWTSFLQRMAALEQASVQKLEEQQLEQQQEAIVPTSAESTSAA